LSSSGAIVSDQLENCKLIKNSSRQTFFNKQLFTASTPKQQITCFGAKAEQIKYFGNFFLIF
jgi:hypothetical protein